MNSEIKTFRGKTIMANSANCAGCYLCQLYCSFKVSKAFNPSRAHIKILRLVNQSTEYLASFSNKCDACGVCAKYCPYGALVYQKST